MLRVLFYSDIIPTKIWVLVRIHVLYKLIYPTKIEFPIMIHFLLPSDIYPAKILGLLWPTSHFWIDIYPTNIYGRHYDPRRISGWHLYREDH